MVEIVSALLGQPIMIFAADRPALLRARRQVQERNLTCAAYVEAMFSTGHDAANREAFRVEPAEEPGLVGVALAAVKVRKLFKKVGQDIAADPELSADLLDPFKSQGVGAVEDGTLVIRAKLKARRGSNSRSRKAVLTGAQRAFRENGIVAVPKPLSLPEA